MKNKFKVNLRVIEILVIIILVISIADCVKDFFLSFHNVDLSYNAINLQNQINAQGLYTLNGTNIRLEGFTDIGSDFVERPIEDYYISSLNTMENVFTRGIILSIFLGLFLGIVMLTNDKNNTKSRK